MNKKIKKKKSVFHLEKGGGRWFRVEFLRQKGQAQLTKLVLEDNPEQ